MKLTTLFILNTIKNNEFITHNGKIQIRNRQ